MTITVLTAHAEAELAQQIEAGLFARELLDHPRPGCPATDRELVSLCAAGERAWQQLWEANLRLVWHLAWRTQRRTGIAVDELFAEGQVALAEALMRWDHRRGIRVSTLAWKWINHTLNGVARRRRRELAELASDDSFGDLAQAGAGFEEGIDLREQPLWWHDLDGQEKALVLALRRDPPPSTHELCHRLELSRSGLSRLRQRTRASIQQVLSRTQAA